MDAQRQSLRHDLAGGSSRDGTIFELPNGSSTITTLATFNGAEWRISGAGLIMAAAGNLYGMTLAGGSSDPDGTVFELAKGSTTITTLASFSGATEQIPRAAWS